MAPRSWAERAHTALLRLYPGRFRQRFGPSIRFAFATEAAETRARGRLPFAAFWCRSVAHILVYAALERFTPRDEAGSWRHGLLTDIAYAQRRLRRSPGFTTAAVVTLALGIGANTAIFSLVHGVVLNPLPYPEPERLVAIRHSAEGAGLPLMGISHGTYVHYRELNQSFEEITLYTNRSVALLEDAGAQRIPGAVVTQGFFEIFLDGPPALGRALADSDQAPGAPRVAMISDELWRSRYGSDPDIVGRAIQLDGLPVEVVGILPAAFDMPSDRTQVWLPEQLDT